MLPPLSTYIRRTYNHHRHRQSLRYLKSFYDSFLTYLASSMDSTTAPPPPFSAQPLLSDNATSNPDPPPFNPKEPAIPISYPLKTLEELENRSYLYSFHFEFNKSSVKLQSGGGGGGSLPQRPRILVCHDMAGGYTADDKWVQGGNNPDAYAIWHWYLMDVFVYFAHSLVALPPPGWTNTGHKHGVKVLGTFIMEWDDGKIMADKLLSTTASAHMYAERLTELAQALGFDGWLLNMEVTLDASQIPTLKEFVDHLSQTMHSSVPGSLVIWYDSVTVNGDLDWQNQLNSLNKPFFDLCDGIFVNYTWQESYPKDSAAVAGDDRKHDVYMGIDVFGRGTYGGGQWTTNAALDVIKKDDVSAAIFAPGWVYETKQPPNFETAQNRWWSLVEKSWGISQKYPITLPFYTNFDQGHGYHFSVAGAQLSNAPWNNIASQSFQPFLKYTEDSADTIHASIGFDEGSYNGGGNVTFKGTLVGNAYFTSRLFVGNLVLEDKPLHFIYSVKSENENYLIGLSLQFSSTTNKAKRLVLLASSHGDSLLTMNRFSNHYDSIIMPHTITKLDQEPGWILQESSIHLPDSVLTEIHAFCYSAKYVDRVKSEYHAVLGHLLVKTSSQNLAFPPSTSWVVQGDYIDSGTGIGSDGSQKMSLKLSWKLKKNNENASSLFPNYNIYVQKIGGGGDPEYVGVAKVETYYLSEIVIPSGTTSLKFVVQACDVDGATQKLAECPFFVLYV